MARRRPALDRWLEREEVHDVPELVGRRLAVLPQERGRRLDCVSGPSSEMSTSSS